MTYFNCGAAVWKANELRQVLMPTLEKLYRQEPDSIPFRQPVNPVEQGIPVSVEPLFYTSVFTQEGQRIFQISRILIP